MPAYTSTQVDKLQDMRDNDPRFAGHDDAQFFASVNLADIDVLKNVTASEVFNAFVGSELPARNSDDWENLMALGTFNSSNSFKLVGNVLSILTSVFAPPTTTRANLVALSTEAKSPAQIAGLPPPSLGTVQRTT